jgi:cytochrome P450
MAIDQHPGGQGDGPDPDDLLIELMSEPQPSDPYPLYHALRSVAPNHPSMLGVRFLSSHEACLDMLRSSKFQNGFGAGADEYAGHPFIEMTKEILIFTHPPQHTRLRRLALHAFTPRTVAALAPKVEGFVDDCLDRIAEAGTTDLIADLASPAPAMVLCEMLGAPVEDHTMVQRWVDAIANPVKPVLEDDLIGLADDATVALDRYLRELVSARRTAPGDDLLSALVAAEEEGDRLSEQELINLLFTIIAAGNETTTSAISTGTMLLLQHPDERRKVLADPELVMGAVDETLRYESPLQNTFMRVALEDTEIAGEPIVENEQVMALVGAANRDPAVFEDPDEFRVDRPNFMDSLAFGNGIHFCIGRAIGRQTAATAIGRLVRRFADLELVETPVWRKTLPSRRLDRLEVTVGASAGAAMGAAR